MGGEVPSYWNSCPSLRLLATQGCPSILLHTLSFNNFKHRTGQSVDANYRNRYYRYVPVPVIAFPPRRSELSQNTPL